MQTAFLKRVAQEVYQKYSENIGDIYIILPSRRACMYFKQYLGEVMDKTVFAPAVLSMEGFAKQLSQLQKVDGVTLLFELYETYKEFDKEITLEKFAPLGSSMLRDFNMIDNNLSEKKTEEMFEYLEEVKAIERWASDLGEDEEAFKEQYLNGKKKKSSLTDFLTFWQHLSKTYFNFRKKLQQKGIAFGGLAFREAYNRLDIAVEEMEIKNVVFAGFSQVSTVEEDLIRRLTEKGLTDLYFDSDRFYLDKKDHEAGYFLRRFEQTFAKHHPDFKESYIGKEEKTIDIIQVNSNPSQAKLVGEILKNSLSTPKQRAYFSKTVNHTGILLPDESLLQPLLYSLPNIEFEDGDKLADKANITMGIALQNTPLFDLLQAVFKMQEALKKTEEGYSVYFKDVLNIVRHPYFQYSISTKEYRGISEGVQKEIIDNSLIYIPLPTLHRWADERDENFGDDAPHLYKAVFTAWQGDPKTAIDQLIQMIASLVDIFLYESSPVADFDLGETSEQPFENELLLKLYTTLVRLGDILNAKKEKITIGTFKILLMELLRGINIPFTGKPIAPLQIMGMLESRALDFEHVIILSCNEGKLPIKKTVESLIPYDLRIQYGMPTYKHNDIAFAYTFYRLFHRTNKFTFITLDATSSLGGGETSRFITQVEEELAKYPQYKIKVNHQILKLDLPDLTAKQPYIVSKDEALIDTLKAQLEKEISPSLLNVYIKNPLQFLEMKILKIRESDELEESLDFRTFGTLLHETLEVLLERHIGKYVDPSDLDEMLKGNNIESAIQTVISKSKDKDIINKNLTYGKNYLLHKVADSLVKRFIEQQKGEKESPFFLVSQERTYGHTMQVVLTDGSKIPFRIQGKADRIDILKNTIRIVDYKTGAYKKEKLKADSWTTLLEDPEKEKIVQLLAYKYILLKNIESGKISNRDFPVSMDLKTCEVKAGFFFFRQLSDGFVEYKLEDEPESREEFFQYAEAFFSAIIRDMMDKSKPFSEEPSEFLELD